VVTVDDEQAHRSHFLARAQDTRARRNRNYLDHFNEIRTIQNYLRSLAVENGVAVVPSYSLDTTVARVMQLVVSELTDASDLPPPHVPVPDPAAPAASVPVAEVSADDIVFPGAPRRP
jgi:2-phosphoglycerate kinase